ncbi:hypothetical protein NUITMVRE36_36710 [Enterococcus raffinosus]|nr:hypothetical protein NUITMVRE36_36710 [Enterococcus raffinosus]
MRTFALLEVDQHISDIQIVTILVHKEKAHSPMRTHSPNYLIFDTQKIDRQTHSKLSYLLNQLMITTNYLT